MGMALKGKQEKKCNRFTKYAVALGLILCVLRDNLDINLDYSLL